MPLVIARARKNVFYGWWIAGAGLGMQFMMGLLIQSSFGAYARILRDEFNWSRTFFSAVYSLSRFETGSLGPLEGWLIDHFGPRAIMRVGVVMTGSGFILFSQIQSAWMFFLAFTIMTLGASLSSYMPVSVALVNWFERRRARALSILSFGMALGGLMVPLVVISLDVLGWRTTAFLSGIIIICAGLPIAQIVRHRPEPYGYFKDGIAPIADDGVGADGVRRAVRRDYGTREALTTPAFWWVSLGHSSALLIVGAVQVHMFLHITENLGYSNATAGLVISMMTATQMCGQAMTGALGDRWSKRWIAAVCMFVHAIGIVMLAFATNFLMIVAFAVFHGLAWGARGPLMGALRADFFGGSNYGAIMGWSSMIAMLGNIAGPLLAGILADQTGNYETGFTILAVVASLGAVFFYLAKPPGQPKQGGDARVASEPLTPNPAPVSP